MEHTFSITAGIILLTAAAVIGLYSFSGFFEEEKAFSEESEVSVSEKEPEKMLLGVFEGKLALFIGESPYPNKVYDFFVRNLPEEDRKILSAGMEISSEAELRAILEDYMS